MEIDMMKEPDVMVYLMTGFLDSGKTQFLNFTLSQDYFQIDGKTLLILCEEGEEEYDSRELLKYGVVIETVEDKEDLTEEWLEEMNKMKVAEKLDMVVLMLTDVMKEASDLLFVGSDVAASGFEKAFGGKLANNSVYKEKCLSRKKQVIPPLEGAFKK